jgi:homocysteine S-methyltransferase
MKLPAVNALSQWQRSQEVLILDGGLGTELERRGHDTSGTLWSGRVLLENPGAIEQVHYDYFAAGADCVVTASYQVTYEAFATLGLTRDQTTSLLLRSVEIAQGARARFLADGERDRRKVYVAACIGPYGARLQDGSEYHGRYNASVKELAEFHEPRLDVLAGSAADLLACETIPVLDEARALATLMRNHPSTAAWFTFTSPDGVHTSHGEKLTNCARLLDDEANIIAVGVNCLHPRHVSQAIRSLKIGTGKPLVVYPNSGEVWSAAERRWVGPADDERLADLAPEWIESGARIVGGCCRTGPDDIAQLARVLRPGGPDLRRS